MESVEKVVIDTNAVLRFLLNDNEEQSKQVGQIIARFNCIVPVEVITEVVFVLSKVYFYGREAICEKIKDFSKIKETLLFERDVVCHASKGSPLLPSNPANLHRPTLSNRRSPSAQNRITRTHPRKHLDFVHKTRPYFYTRKLCLAASV